MARSSPRPPYRERAGDAWLALLLLLSTACKPSAANGGVGIADAGKNKLLAVPESPSASAPPTVVEPSARPPKAASKGPPGPTAEALALEASKRVGEAVQKASGKDVCPEVLPLLDVSYSLVRTTTPLDEKVLGVFATCAMKHRRWRLLRDLADAIAAGERKLETTYFLPRAFVGEGAYETANTLAKATLRAWPTEGDAYDTGALAAFRVKDWDAAMKAADQALLLQRKRNTNDDVTAFAHGLRGAALLRMGKTEEGIHEIGLAKSHEGVLRVLDVTEDAAHSAKEHGVFVTVDAPDVAYPSLFPLYAKKVAPLGGLVSVTLQNLTDKPIAALVEVALDGAENAAESETVTKGKPVMVTITPDLKKDGPLTALKASEAHDLSVTVTGQNHATLYHETRKVVLEPGTKMPKVLAAHGDDLRSAFALEALWVTPSAPEIKSLVEAAKARLHAPMTAFEGRKGPSGPQVQALWDELRSRGVAFRRDPKIDTETEESVTCRMPADILAAGTGDALESTVLFASMLEAIGLDVVLVRTPGHRMVGWLATGTDLAGPETGPSAVKSPKGQAFFLETTTVGEGPFDAAVLRGDAEWVAATNEGLVTTGRAEVEGLGELRKRGLVTKAP
jgi:hypothetical protein